MTSQYLTRTQVLNRIHEELNMVHQWREKPINIGFIERVNAYAHRAEALIELLEIHDCGSVGGYGNGHTGSRDLEQRYKWLTEFEVNSYDE